MTAPQRSCRECKSDFATEDRHTRCSRCRRLTPCPMCGKTKMRESSVCKACVDRSGADNPNWKGGKTRHKAGYIMVRTSCGYMFAHRIVMEEKLGRKLMAEETVHHKNGIKTDNSPDNLELWVTHQPSGQRVEDLVTWAEEILRRYNQTPSGST